MKNSFCEKEGCTVQDSGKCVELHQNLDECPYYKVVENNQPENINTITEIPEDIEDENRISRKFYSGLELGLDDAKEIMKARYVNLIGIVGFSDAGKTCFLSSLYLLTSILDAIPDLIFAGSLTLQGFELRAKKVRKWEKNKLPQRLSDRTTIQDPRNPSFLHLSYLYTKTNKFIDFLFTDLPGEWFNDFVKSASVSERFNFMTRVDGIILVLDSETLNNINLRNKELRKTELLMRRFKENINFDKGIPLILALSKIDKNDNEFNIGDFIKKINNQGWQIIVKNFCAFSSKSDKIKSGEGIPEILKTFLSETKISVDSNTLKKRNSYKRSFRNFI